MAASGNKPSTDSVSNSVAACLARHVNVGQSLLIALSGGLDSTVLTHVVTHVAPQLKLDMAAIHIHHGLSPNADEWAEHCRSMCAALNVPLRIVHVEVPRDSGEGIECAARRLRKTAIFATPHDWTLMAHHRGDQAETVLHNLLRGAGVRGAAAMAERNGKILRPLLGLAQRALMAYANNNTLSWVDDESNSDLRYTRNHLRHRILPLIRERFPQAEHQLAAAANRFGDALTLLEELAVVDLGRHARRFPLPVSVFREITELRAVNLLRALLAWNQLQSPDDVRVREFVRQLRTARPDRHPLLDFSEHRLECRGGMLCLSLATEHRPS